MDRRKFLAHAGLSTAGTLAAASLSHLGFAEMGFAEKHAVPAPAGSSFALRVEPMSLELAPGITVETVGYNGQVPGPLLRMRQGVPVTVDVVNNSPIEEIVHWHGFAIDPRNDGATQEGSPAIPPGSHLRYHFTPTLGGSRWYHTHAYAGTDMSRSTYSGQFGFAYIEAKDEPGDYDHEVFLAVHHWATKMQMLGPPTDSYGVAIHYGSFNDKMLAASAPIQVRKGERVLFHFLNASPFHSVSIALAGHRFQVRALDGNPVPVRRSVNNIALAVAERVDAIVEMDNPGVWILGSISEQERAGGLGIPIEYANCKGPAVWQDPHELNWDYTIFSGPVPAAPSQVEETFRMEFTKRKDPVDNIDRWLINGKTYEQLAPLEVRAGKRYRLAFSNPRDQAHPLHLHRHSFEVVRINDRPVSGMMKDTINIDGAGRVEVEFVADNPGPFLFHCHNQLHMDFGFMQLLRYM